MPAVLALESRGRRVLSSRPVCLTKEKIWHTGSGYAPADKKQSVRREGGRVSECVCVSKEGKRAEINE